jgi:cephalosporin-C deacetylase-like acetyl esterase
MFPGLLTEGIAQTESYMLRSIVADSVRGLEFLLTQPALDAEHVVVVGQDMALMTAALHAGATYVVSTPSLFYDTAALAPRTQAYPLEEVNDYLRAFPQHTAAVQHTLHYYDLRAFAPRVRATTLLMAGAPGSLLDGETLRPLAAALSGPVTVHESEQSSYKDGLYTETWIATQCGITDVQAILPAHWQ